MAMEEDARRGYCYVRRESTLKHMLYGGSFLTRPLTACSFPSTGAAWFGSPLRTSKGHHSNCSFQARSYFLLKGWSGSIPYCAHRPSTVLSCGPQTCKIILPSLLLLPQGGGLVDPRMRASNEALLRARVPRAGGRPGRPISRFHHFQSRIEFMPAGRATDAIRFDCKFV